jgi:inositol 3-alpha-galactosyltransferase
MGRTCYVVFLLGSASYLPGILVLASSLRKYKSRHPLRVLYNDTVSLRALQVLQNYGVTVQKAEQLRPHVQITSIAERFADTWTKMQVWGMTEYEVRP